MRAFHGMRFAFLFFAILSIVTALGCGGGTVKPSSPAPAPTDPPAPAAPTLTFAAAPATIASGSSSTLSWTTANATSLTIDNGIGAQQNVAAGSVSVAPTATTTYTATASGANNQSVTQQVTVTVTAPPPPAPAPTLTFTAAPPTITSGGSSTLTWATTNATSLTIDNGVGPQQNVAAGSVAVMPTATTTYTATAVSADNQTVMQTAVVTVAPPGPTASPLQHVIVVIMQNRSFDQLFGVYPGTNGNTVEGIRPGIPGFTQIDKAGKTVSPFLQTNPVSPLLPESRTAYLGEIDNGLMDKYAFFDGDVGMGYFDSTIPGIPILWSYADQFALADHYFSSAIAEAPTNQLYMIAAQDNNNTKTIDPAFGPCNQNGSPSPPLTFTNVADELSASGFTSGVFQESFGICSNSSSVHNGFQYFTSTQASTQDYVKFAGLVKNGNVPSVSFIIPSGSDDLHPGNNKPISVGVGFIDALVHEVQASPIWSTTAIIVTFDTAGGWYDHVPPPVLDAQGLGPRVPTLVISPFAKKGYVSHVQMDHVSILRFIQWNWRLSSLNDRNALSGDMNDMFQF